MRWSFDRTGYPVLELPQSHAAVTLWPACKAQFERYFAEPDGPDDSWYEQVLAVSPRASLRTADSNGYENLLLAGVHPAESQKFAHWLGNGYKLPTVEQWRSIDRELLATPLTAGQTTELESSPQLSRSARQMLHCILKHSPPNWAGLALMRGGLLEWVSSGPMTYGGLGVPRPQYYSLIINPQRDRPVTPLRPDRNKVFGFRLVRSLN